MTSILMKAICDPDNVASAVRAVVRNKGAPGVDGITVRQLPDVLQARWPKIEVQLLQGRYQPQPVRRVQIPKPAGGTRDLGIPTVIDRVIQQAVLSSSSRCGTRHSASIATASGRAARLTRRWRRRRPT
jgi:RNA-directed DNA polymerase